MKTLQRPFRDEDAATAFFKQAINNNGFPDKVVMDKSGANYAGLQLAYACDRTHCLYYDNFYQNVMKNIFEFSL
jgi:transposase-like protein